MNYHEKQEEVVSYYWGQPALKISLHISQTAATIIFPILVKEYWVVWGEIINSTYQQTILALDHQLVTSSNEPRVIRKWVCPEYIHEIAAQWSNRLMNIKSLGADINANLRAFVSSEFGHSINIWVNSSKTDKKWSSCDIYIYVYF